MRFDFGQCKYGLFVHMVHRLSPMSDGTVPQNFDAAVNAFDAEGFANDVASMGVEYVIITAWHYQIRPLYPSRVHAQYRSEPSCSRDLLGEIIDACNARGIKVLLYTHPRDGHDLEEPDRTACGWSPKGEQSSHKPEPPSFNRERWNAYMQAVYAELAERYAAKICGFYTDGMGPYDGKSLPAENRTQVVDYIAIRHIMKSANPSLAMLQNHFGYIFSNDFAMPEGYFGYEQKFPVGRWPAAQKALAICPFGGWWPTAPVEKDVDGAMSAADLTRFLLFNASCAAGGGLACALSPYWEGSVWQKGSLPRMREVGNALRTLAIPLKSFRKSRSYPTLSGDTLEACAYRFFTSDERGDFEYLHILKAPEGNRILLDAPVDGAVLSDPVSLCGGVSVDTFEQRGNGYFLGLSGNFDAVDTVLRFKRCIDKESPESEWINDTDKRIRYSSGWQYEHLTADESSYSVLGAFESDLHLSRQKGSTLFLAFEGSFAEIYCGLRKDGGAMDVYIDDILLSRIETKADGAKNRVLAFRSPDLHGGWHTLYAVTAGDAPVALDAVRIVL